ncbi:MAG: DNA translocase FtsK 4TM domain-containing protein, partial [Olsenella sp.]
MQAPGRTGLSSTQNDIVALFLAVVAIAMFVSLVVPSSAVVTSAVGHALTLCFGTGAILFPIAVFLFAMTFFMDENGPISGRVALGLSLIVLAVLAMLSLNIPGAGEVPDIVLSPVQLEGAGGYVGGGIAYALLKLVG